MDRFWLLTWTTYGTWLPGDRRGFVSDLRDEQNAKYRFNQPGTDLTADLPGLRNYSERTLKCPPILLTREHADLLLEQFRETATYRGWRLFAVAVMSNHTHLVVGAPGDPEPETLLRDLKSYGSRALNRGWGKPESGTWWTESGSTRKLPDENAVHAAISYVANQHDPLIVWIAGEGERGA